MSITKDSVMSLREKTGAGLIDCKRALAESNGDMDEAVSILRKKGVATAAKKSGRSASEGVIAQSISSDRSKGILVEVNCETDFVAKTDGFVELAHNLAMQIAATNPIALDKNSVSDEIISKEKEIYTEQAKSSGKPDNIIEKMVEGRLAKFYQENCLMEQAYIKDSEKKINDLVTETIATLGENITINRYTRFAIGETDSEN